MKIAFLKRDIPKRCAAIAAAVAAALIAAASLVAGREKPALEVVESKPAPALRTAAGAPEIDLAKLQHREAEAPHGDPFAPRDFAPPVRQASAGPRAPQGVPPLPFTYVGWLTQDGKTEVFVARGEELISIAAGRKIDAQYRVDSITDARIRFTYLPRKTRQVLERTEAEEATAG